MVLRPRARLCLIVNGNIFGLELAFILHERGKPKFELKLTQNCILLNGLSTAKTKWFRQRKPNKSYLPLLVSRKKICFESNSQYSLVLRLSNKTDVNDLRHDSPNRLAIISFASYNEHSLAVMAGVSLILLPLIRVDDPNR